MKYAKSLSNSMHTHTSEPVSKDHASDSTSLYEQIKHFSPQNGHYVLDLVS